MPLPMPRLDNRTFDQLLDEGRSLLPRLAPAWTDHNAHDPGITLIELLAWLVETEMYRLDRISPAAYRAFLRLIGIEPYPPQVAETVLVFQVAPGSKPIKVHRGTSIENKNGQIKFQTSRNLTASPARLTKVLAGSEAAPLDCTRSNATDGKRYAPFGKSPQPGDALFLGFDNPLSEKQAQVSLYVWANPPESDADLKRRLIETCKTQKAELKNREPQALHQRIDWRQHYSVRTVWEYYAESNAWLPLEQVIDETRGLTLNGAVRFLAPDLNQHKQGLATYPDRYFIRCRLERGHFDCPPQILGVAINAIPAHHGSAKVTVELGESNGRAGQLFQLQPTPIVPGSTHVFIKEGRKKEEWREALNWDRVGPHDRTYMLAPETGQITFGNGMHGRVPPAGAKILAQYQIGGGVAGNVAADVLTKCSEIKDIEIAQPFAASGGAAGNVAADVLTKCSEIKDIAQPFAASGGAAAESLVEAMGRANAWLRDTRRAITLTDFEQLALKTPGVPVARAHALTDHHPALPGLPALGSVTVVVVPQCADPIPEPGPDMLRAIKQYLDRRRLVTSELYVIGPKFITIAVQARLHTSSDIDAPQLIAQARARLETFFHPLHGGPDAKGWPMGRDLYRAEIMARLNAIPGVKYVDEVTIQVEAELSIFDGNVAFKRIIDPGEATVVVRGRILIAPTALANQVVDRACNELEGYIRSQRGWLKHKRLEAKRAEAIATLNGITGVLRVDEICLNDQPASVGLCENLGVCPDSLVISGQHKITVVQGE